MKHPQTRRPADPQTRSGAIIPINSMIIGKPGTYGDRQTFGIGADGDPLPTLSTAHHHAVAYAVGCWGREMHHLRYLKKAKDNPC